MFLFSSFFSPTERERERDMPPATVKHTDTPAQKIEPLHRQRIIIDRPAALPFFLFFIDARFFFHRKRDPNAKRNKNENEARRSTHREVRNDAHLPLWRANMAPPPSSSAARDVLSLTVASHQTTAERVAAAATTITRRR